MREEARGWLGLIYDWRRRSTSHCEAGNLLAAQLRRKEPEEGGPRPSGKSINFGTRQRWLEAIRPFPAGLPRGRQFPRSIERAQTCLRSGVVSIGWEASVEHLVWSRHVEQKRSPVTTHQAVLRAGGDPGPRASPREAVKSHGHTHCGEPLGEGLHGHPLCEQQRKRRISLEEEAESTAWLPDGTVCTVRPCVSFPRSHCSNTQP
nr:uncharacterized protein LOC111774473 [Equus caballus]